MNYTKKAVKGAGLVFLTIGLSSFLGYFIRIILARNLSPTEYGLFYAVFTFMMFFLVFRDIGLGSALTKFIAEYQVKKDYSKIKTLITSAFIFQLISSSIIIIFLLILSPFLANYYFKIPSASIILAFLMIYVFFSLLFRTTKSILTGFQDVKWYSLAESLRLGITLISAFLFFYFGFKIFSPVFAFILGVIIAFLILLIGASKYFFIFKYPMKNYWKTTKQLFGFGIPVIFTGIGNTIIGYLDVLILIYFVSLKAVGIYNVILPTATAFLFFGTAVSTVLFPMISELWSKKDKVRISEGIRLIYTYSFILTVPLLFTVFAFSEIFIRLFFGNEYVAAILAFRILLFGVLCYIIAVINNTALSGIGKPKIVTKIIFISAAVNIILNLLLIPTFNITGAAIATSVSYFTVLILSTIKLSKFIKIVSPWKNWFKSVFAGFIFVLIIYITKTLLVLNSWFEMIISLTIAGIIYLLLIWILKIVEINEIKTLVKRVF